MSNLPLRDLGAVGVLPDAKPYDLQPNAFSAASNVVFDDGVVQRAPVFKQLFPAIRSVVAIDSLAGTIDSVQTSIDGSPSVAVDDVRFVGSYADPVAGETLFVCDATGRIRGYPNGNLQDLTPVSISTSESVWSHAQVAGMSFLARDGMRPLVRRISDSGGYVPVAGDWVADHSAAVIRGYNDFVVALNITKGSQKNPTMVKWSNPVAFGNGPEDVLWDPANPNYVSGENPIGEMTSAIRDGLTLGSVMILYTADQVWAMEYTGSTFVFNFRRLFRSGGIINTNCVVEVDAKHFVFGDDDIYVHDGYTQQSLADGKVRRYVYGTIDRARLQSCFVIHDSVANLIYFCFPSKEQGLPFQATQFCNRAAVFNYRSNTWTFMDMPNVVGGTSINLVLSSNEYLKDGPTVSELYDTSSGLFSGTAPRLTAFLGVPDVSNGLTAARVYALDLPATNMIRLEPHPETLKTAFVERRGIDLDDPGLQLPLRSYKTIDCMFPLVESANAVRWLVGAADKPNDNPVWYSDRIFDPSADYKLDMRVSGRFLAYRIEMPGPLNFRLSGFDAEVKAVSRR